MLDVSTPTAGGRIYRTRRDGRARSPRVPKTHPFRNRRSPRPYCLGVCNSLDIAISPSRSGDVFNGLVVTISPSRSGGARA